MNISNIDKIDCIIKRNWMNSSDEVTILINGIELREIIKDIEQCYMNADEQKRSREDYSNMTPKLLYSELVKDYSDEFGASVFCCPSCGESECTGLHVYIKNDEKYTYWYKFDNFYYKNLTYNISFKFLNGEYNKFLNRLKNNIS